MRFIVSQYCCSWWSRSYDCMQNIVSMGSGEKYWTPCWILVAFVITNSRKDRLLTLMILMYCVVILWDLSQERYLLQDNKYLQEQFDDVSSIMNYQFKDYDLRYPWHYITDRSFFNRTPVLFGSSFILKNFGLLFLWVCFQ